MFERVTQKQFHCCRCGHDWSPRKKGVPVRCGGCKTPYWNVPKPGEVAPETKEYEEIK